MTELLIGVLLQGLKLLEIKEANKYIDKVIDLQTRYTEEFNKPKKQRNNMTLDEIEEELFIISKAFLKMQK